MTAVTILAFVLLVAGVIGCIVPRVPGIVASLAGVFLYWWSTGYTEPSTVVIVLLGGLGVAALCSSLIADHFSSRIGGAARTTGLLAGAVGAVVLVVTGPLGMFLATILTVFLLEYRRQRNVRAAGRAALAVVVSSIGSRVFRLALAILMLVIMAVTVLF